MNNKTIFTYHQQGNIVTAEYSGGNILSGHLIAVSSDEGMLDMRYHHITDKHELRTGICSTIPEIKDGKLLLHEKWQWTNGDMSSGESILEEIL